MISTAEISVKADSPAGALGLRAVLLTDSILFAGTERHILDLACGLIAEGIEASIACPSGSPLHQRASQSGMSVVTVSPELYVPRMIFALGEKLSKGEIDLIHAHNGVSQTIAASAVTLAGRGRVVATEHFIVPKRYLRKGLTGAVSRTLHRYLSCRVDYFIAISQAVANALKTRKDCPDDRLLMVHNGSSPPPDALGLRDEVRHSYGLAKDAFLIVAAARLDREKNLDVLIRAMATVCKTSPDARCIIAGEGNERDLLTDLIGSCGLENSVHLVGYKSDVQSLINASDVFVLPSEAEPFGLVLLEAMLLGKPVIAARAGGPAEIVLHECTGLLFTPGDADALATAILRVGEGEAAARMAERGLARAREHFNVERMSKQTAKAYLAAMRR